MPGVKTMEKKKQPVADMPVHTVKKQYRATAPVFITVE